MPGVLVRSTRATRGRPAPATKAPGPLDNFIRVSKLQTTGKDVAQKVASIHGTKAPAFEIVLKSRKRGAEDDLATDNGAKKARKVPEVQSRPIAPLRKKKTVTFAEPEPIKTSKTTQTKIAQPKSTRKLVEPTTPQGIRKRQLESEDPDSPEALLEKLNLRSPVTSKRPKATSIPTQDETDYDLPQDLLDILDLHTAFLKTLSVTYAHNGGASPIDVRCIYSAIAQAWGKRTVTLDDIRLCIGVLGWKAVKSTIPPVFFIADYGRGKVAIEHDHKSGNNLLREKKLNMEFEVNLRALWSGRRSDNTKLFIATLPRAPVRDCTLPHPVVAKSQRTLEELKGGVVKKQQQKEEIKAATPTVNADGSKMTLLDRIRHKEAEQAKAVQGPTPAELARRAALQRAEDVADVIGMLCMATGSGQARMSFTMAALMTKVMDSLRNAVSQEDGVLCVKILAAEIAPQWLRVVSVGGRENVVVQKALQPTKAAIQERIKVLLG
ncbi:hypothetical protein OQA88_10510 [Cercophora sp. LCS_1]